jgi:1-acyl-sn-glycerol-3-phosphate acyltransferase
LPVISFLMRSFGIIRVREQPIRRETPPEIGEAIAALDRGECVVVFPEGYLRRSEERPLRRFGRGVWQVLKARPNTPVYTIWIEGGWGSYTSYFNGRPSKNKKLDRRRPIGVAVPEAAIIDAAVLENHIATRIMLMNKVIEARKHLGLPELPRFDVPHGEEGEEE